MEEESLSIWIENHASYFRELSDKIWHFAEIRFQEIQSAQALCDVLSKYNFQITKNIADIPTAFSASFGTGHPIIGILGEFDALPGLSQQVGLIKIPIQTGGNGHGCGHNLLGVGSLATCLAVQAYLVKNKIQGTIRYYGCPAEEGGSGKVFMLHAGAFSDCDLCMTWHPEDINMVAVQNWEAVIGVKFQFHGRAAHAASDPYNGRSALDAVELMNVASNYLREHILPSIKLHYIITHGGDAPNVVPDFAENYFYIRAPHLKNTFPVLERLKKIAQGAALMTETEYSYRTLHGGSNYLSNQVIESVYFDKMTKIGPPAFDAHDLEFATAIQKTLPPEFFEYLVAKVPSQYHAVAEQFRNKPLMQAVLPIFGRDAVLPGSTDVGDVSWVVPTAQINTACYALGSPNHSWQRVVQAGMSIGHKGMLNAAKILAESAWEFFTKPELVAQARAEFEAKIQKTPYQPPFPKGTKPEIGS